MSHEFKRKDRVRVYLGRCLLALIAAHSAVVPSAATADQPPPRPNILWITSEDNSAHWLGCYGNEQASTPRLDALAREGVTFDRAYANAAVCAVARSTILTGVYAIAQGTQHMRSRYAIAPQFRPYVSYLREHGYYCTNNVKTDYNILGDDRALWDACSAQAHYRNRPAGQPFFAIFNLTETHESSLFDAPPKGRSQERPAAESLAPSAVDVPPIYPDIPEIRADVAAYRRVVATMDRRVGALLDELAAAGLAEETIVFYYADHGGTLPRAKRYLYDSGTRVPLIVRVPSRYRHLSPFAPWSRADELVSFVDLAPTLLSLADVEIPAHMQGRPLLGAARRPPADDAVVLLYADRFDEAYRHQRGITNGRYKVICNFTPHQPRAPQNGYPYGIASWRALERGAREHRLEPRFARFWEAPQPAHEWYDLAADPWEIRNLALEQPPLPEAVELQARLREELRRLRDLGFVPEPFWPEWDPQRTPYDVVRADDFPWDRIVDLAFRAPFSTGADVGELAAQLDDRHPVIRYWALYGCLLAGPQLPLGAERDALAERLAALLEDAHAANRATAAHALARLQPQHPAALATLRDMALSPPHEPAGTLAMHTLFQLDATDVLTNEELAQIRTAAPASYASRWAERALTARRTVAESPQP
jgi:arylsulfatase A-like enzyme